MKLSELLKLLNDNNHDGKLGFVPDALSTGRIADLCRRVIPSGVFVIDGATVTESADKKTIRVVGATSALGGTVMTLTFEFTEASGGIAASLVGSLPGATWQLPGVPWFGLAAPSGRLTVSELDAIPISGALSGTIRLGDFVAEVSALLPSAEDQWRFTAAFADDNRPSAASLFAMVGGINLTALLPPPLSTFTDLGASNIDLAYDDKKRRLASIAVNLKSELAWDIVPAVSLTGLEIGCVITDPGDVKTRSTAFEVTGHFKIAKGQVDVTATYPNLMVKGMMPEDSEPISLSDVINQFLPGADVELGADLTELSFFVQGEPRQYSLSCGLDTDWPISVNGEVIFKITGLKFGVEKAEKQITGSFSGTTVLLPDDPDVQATLVLSAAYLGSESGWVFEGRQTAGALPLGKLVEKYLLPGTDVGNYVDLSITDLYATIRTKDSSYAVGGKATWPLPFEGVKAQVIATADLAYGPVEAKGLAVVSQNGTGKNGSGQNGNGTLTTAQPAEMAYSGKLCGTFLWGKDEVSIKVCYEFGKQEGLPKYTLQAKIYDLLVDGSLAPNGEQQWIGKLSTRGLTLGGLIETLISWATGQKFGLAAPWNLLDKVPLDIDLTFNFTTRAATISLPLGIDLGFAKLDSIDLIYNPDATGDDKKVAVTLKGRFLWLDAGKEPEPWDATKPEQTPTPSGGGNKYFDLRLLGLGQHVKIHGSREFTSVQDAIAKIREALAVPQGCKIPIGEGDPSKPYFSFAPDSSWFIAADFGVLRFGDEDKKKNGNGSAPQAMLPASGGRDLRPQAGAGEGGDEPEKGYLLKLSIIFNDPELYALRVALAGPAAKVFKGLDFQIMYSRVTDTVGKYQAEITLPDVMRNLTVGAYSITLPVFGIAIYTNGDFKVDVGFPWNQDFARSFTVQGIVPPGIPVLGSAGFYFGKLSDSTAKRLPAHDSSLGQFNPVIIFGFGLQVGVGKYVEYGILKAGFSITVFGIIEGIIARWNPYELPAKAGGNNADLQKSYYFWLQGTVGVIGKLFGSVDFAIIKADVNVELKIMVQITFESYADIPITAIASVEISVRVKIDLGLFSIHITLRFSARIKETFTIKNPATEKAPWLGDSPVAPQSIAARHARRLRFASESVVGLQSLDDDDCQIIQMNWSNLQPPATPTPLTGYFMPISTVVGNGATQAEQAANYVMMMFLGAVPMDQDGPEDPAEKSFEELATRVLRWVLAATQPEGQVDPDGLQISDQSLNAAHPVESELNLTRLVNTLGYPCNPDPTPIPVAAIDEFLGGSDDPQQPRVGNFKINFTTPDSGVAAKANATAFPMPPGIELVVPAYGSEPERKYVFGDFNELGADYLKTLRSYFDKLAVIVQEEMDRPRIQSVESSVSMAEYVYTDYFLLIARQMVLGLRAALRNYLYPIKPEGAESVADVVAWAKQAMQADGSADVDYTATDVFEGNPRHALTAGTETAPKLVGLSGLSHAVANGETLATISATYKSLVHAGGSAFEPVDLAGANQTDEHALLVGGSVETAAGPYTIAAGDTLQSIAKDHFGGDLAALVETNKDDTTLFAQLAELVIPSLKYNVAEGDTVDAVTRRFGIDIATFAAMTGDDAPATVKGLFVLGAKEAAYLNLPHLPRLNAKDLIDEALRAGTAQHLSGMAGRYYLHGLRLPTEGIVPPPAAKESGLYSLTGQQFVIAPEFIALDPKTKPAPFVFTLNSKGSRWVELAGGSSVTKTVDYDSQEAKQIRAVYEYATVTGLQPKLNGLGMEKTYKSQAMEYVFASKTNWQSAGDVTLPNGSKPSGTPALALWAFPDSLINLPHLSTAPNPKPQGKPVLPQFDVQLSTYDEATGATDQQVVDYYAWATRIGFKIKKVPTVQVSPSTGYTYELLGANEFDIVLLERLLAAITPQADGMDALTLLYQPSSDGPKAGVQSDGNGRIAMSIAQANLSTYTNPPAGLQSVDGPAEPSDRSYCYNSFYEFVLLLWECSITRSGGFYLYYYDSVRKAGFPDAVFNDEGEASLSLLITHATDSERRVAGYMNCAVTGTFVDPASTSLSARSHPTEIVDWKPSAPPFVDQLMCPVPAEYTLACVAKTYYMNPIQLAEDNAELALAVGVQLVVSRGSYLVLPTGVAGPGGDKDAIAKYFGVTAEALTAANPQISSWPVDAYTAVLLPKLTVTVGTSAGGTTLASMASYYGAQLGDLSADNQAVKAVFGADPAGMVIKGGPNSRTATVPPGAVGLQARRVVPDEPNWPQDPGSYGKLYLEQIYNLLGYRVYTNPWFELANMGLPMGPTESAAPDKAAEKLQRPADKAAGDTWQYQQAMPYWRGAIEGKDKSAAVDLPDAKNSPYHGIGSVLQIDFAWQDLFGNVAVSALDDPAIAAGSPPNKPPIPIGYTDALVGLGRWPSVASSYRVFLQGEQPTLRFELKLDTCPYTKPASKECGRTEENASWQDNARRDLGTYTQLWYQLEDTAVDGGVTEHMVSFWVATSLGGTGLCPELGADVGGRCVQLTPEQADKLRAWVGDIVAYLGKLAAPGAEPVPFASENGCTPATPLVYCIDLPVDPMAANAGQVFELTATFTMARPSDKVAADFRDTPEVYRSTARVGPGMVKQENGIPETSQTYTLKEFAADFEKALSTPDAQLRVAQGVDRERVSEPGVQAPLWVVRLGKASDQGISYRIKNPGAPALFAPRPTSNELESRPNPDKNLPAVKIWDYVPGSGKPIDFGAAGRDMAFRGIDLDVWGREFLAAFDQILAPEFSSPVGIVGQHVSPKTDYIAELLRIKKALAKTLTRLVIPVLDGERPSDEALANARAAFEQQLLIALSNLYSTDGVVQFEAEVKASIQQPAGISEPPRMYGSPVQLEPIESGVSLTSAKLPLQTTAGDPALLTFLLSSSPRPKNGESYVESFIPLNLEFHASNIEQEIGGLPHIDDYEASSWLSFVDSGTASPMLKQPLGQFNVPLPIRAFPTPPAMTAQDFRAAKVAESPTSRTLADKLRDTLRWDYDFTYSEPYHYPQDRTYVRVEFNVQGPAFPESVAAPDLFSTLAEFIVVWPGIRKDLADSLASIDGSTDLTSEDGKAKLAIAKAALESIIAVAGRVEGAWADEPDEAHVVPEAVEANVYEFLIEEHEKSPQIPCSGIPADVPDGALCLHVIGKPAAGLNLTAPPCVEIRRGEAGEQEYWTSNRVEVEDGYLFTYSHTYQKAGKPITDYLTAAKAAVIAERKVVLPQLYILGKQDAWSSAHLTRNEQLLPPPEPATAEPFVYTTEQVKFANPIFPTLDSSEIVHIECIGSTIPAEDGGCRDPQTRKLDEQLGALFTALFKGDPQDSQLLQIEVSYDYSVQADLEPVRLPVLFLPPTKFDVTHDRKPCAEQADSVVCKISTAVRAWLKENAPSPCEATLVFDLTIFSDLAAQSMPLLRLRRIELPLDYVSPE